MGFRVFHIQSDVNEGNQVNHEAKVNDALRQIEDNEEIYSVQHSVGCVQHHHEGKFSTLIVVRAYKD